MRANFLQGCEAIIVLCGLKQGDDLISTDGVAYGIERLRHEFPLQARIEAVDPASRTAYAMVLQAWLENGAAPKPHIIPLFSLNKLLELDALVTTESGLGCYPFSAEKTGISVEYGTHRVNAMCAIDALAIPFLAQRPCNHHGHLWQLRCTADDTSRCRRTGHPLRAGWREGRLSQTGSATRRLQQ